MEEFDILQDVTRIEGIKSIFNLAKFLVTCPENGYEDIYEYSLFIRKKLIEK